MSNSIQPTPVPQVPQAVQDAVSRMLTRGPVSVPDSPELGLGSKDTNLKIRILAVERTRNGVMVDGGFHERELIWDWNEGPVRLGIKLAELSGSLANEIWNLAARGEAIEVKADYEGVKDEQAR